MTTRHRGLNCELSSFLGPVRERGGVGSGKYNTRGDPPPASPLNLQTFRTTPPLAVGVGTDKLEALEGDVRPVAGSQPRTQRQN
jgi:hypothetical protein